MYKNIELEESRREIIPFNNQYSILSCFLKHCDFSPSADSTFYNINLNPRAFGMIEFESCFVFVIGKEETLVG